MSRHAIILRTDNDVQGDFEEIFASQIATNGTEISCIASYSPKTPNSGSTRVAIGTRHGEVQVWDIDGGLLTNRFTTRIPNVTLSALVFADNVARDVIALGFYDGHK